MATIFQKVSFFQKMVKILYALYDLEKQHSSTLSLEEGEVFLSVDDDCRDDWLCVVNRRGEIGFVPETYVESKHISDADLLFEIERKVAAIHDNAVERNETGPCNYTSQQKLFLRKLLEARKSLQASCSSPASEMAEPEAGNGTLLNSLGERRNGSRAASTQTDEEGGGVPSTLLPSLIEKVRNATDLSHSLSVVAVATVLHGLQVQISPLSSTFAKLLNDIENKQNDHSMYVESQDKQKLLEIFDRMWKSKDDEQQRSWPVHEDESLILGNLQELYRILVDADPRVSSEVVKSEGYESVLMLITYYQMETRSKLRLAMLHVFIAMCQLDPPAVEHLLGSVLPVELARDMQNHLENVELVKYSAVLMTVLLSFGQNAPREMYDHINVQFVTFLLGQLQGLLDYTKGDEEIANLCFSVLLAINLHSKENEDLVIEAIRLRDDVRALTEKLMLVVNRGDDPTRLVDIPPLYPNSVVKLLLDLFADPTCAQHFYTNDVKVLLDIIVRHLQDLPYGSQVVWFALLWESIFTMHPYFDQDRPSFVKLVLEILHNTNYGEHCHQQEGLQKCFDSMMLEEDRPSQEIVWVQAIAKEFPLLFSLSDS